MIKVTYLFGAGASAQCLPIVSQIPDRLHKFIEYVEQNRPKGKGDYEQYGRKDLSNAQAENDFLEDCRLILTEVKKHSSIDTYAKKLYITGQQHKYGKLKIILSCFLIWEQYTKEMDSRYDSFFAAILKNNANDFLGDIKILSWNYDFQFEKAYSNYFQKDSLLECQRALRVFPSANDYGDTQRFSIYKLNGTTGFYELGNSKKTHISDSLVATDNFKLVRNFLSFYVGTLYGEMFQPMLSFAWEKHGSLDHAVMRYAKSAIERTQILVIIGYSIPFFNREVDREMIETMAPTLTKVYIQDPNTKQVAESFSSLWDNKTKIEIVQKDTTDQFYLPPEL